MELELKFRLETSVGIKLSLAHLSYLGWLHLKGEGVEVGGWRDWNRSFKFAERKKQPEPGGVYGPGDVSLDSATYFAVELSLLSGWSLSEVKNASEHEINCLQAILADFRQRNEQAEEPELY